MSEWFLKTRLVLLLLVAAISSFASFTPGYAADQPASKRWAIISSPEVQALGVPDVLAAELSNTDGIQLVERDQIAAACRELTIAELAGARQVQARLKLGRTVGADVLLLLIHRPVNRKPGIQVVISDCKLGARLRSEQFMLANTSPEAIVARVRKLITGAQEQFGPGIDSVIGVAPLVSTTLMHDWDYLQTSLADIIQNALANRPGVAVIEIDEAKAIRAEFELAGGSSPERYVPLLVEGTYRVEPPTNGREPTMSVHVVLRDGQKVVASLDKGPLTLFAAAEYLRAESQHWSARIASSGSSAGIGREEQVRFMRDQADQFAALGAYERSTSLREACLLLAPNSTGQRLALAREYSVLIRTPAPWSIENRSMKPAEAQEYLSRLVLNCRLFFQHVDWLVHRPGGFPAGLENVCGDLVLERWTRSDADASGMRDELVRDCLAQTEEFKMRFLLSSPLMLPYMDERHWQFMVVNFARHSFAPRLPDSSQDLHILESLLVEVIPPDQPVFAPLAAWFEEQAGRACPSIFPGWESHLEAFRSFCDRLVARDNPRDNMLGRFGRLRVDLCTQGNKSQGLLAAASDLAAEAEAWQNDELARLFANTRRTINEAGGTPEPPPPGVSRTKWRPPAAFIPPEPVRLKAERLPIQVRDWLGRVRPIVKADNESLSEDSLRLVSCDGKADVFWQETRVLLQNSRGPMFYLPCEPDPIISDVAWDGQRIWVATRRSGLFLFDTRGKAAGRIGPDHGLPPADQGFKLLAIEPGKVLAVGSFGEHCRAWCAIATSADQTSSAVKVFHEATSTDSGRRQFEGVEFGNINLAFVPGSVRRVPGESGRDLVLVSRVPPGGYTGVWTDHAYGAMQIDLRTLAVSLMDPDLGKQLELHHVQDRLVLDDGVMIDVSSDGSVLRCPPGKTFGNAGPLLELGDHQPYRFPERIIPFRDWIYLPGERWWLRIHSTVKTPQLIVLDGFYDKAKAEMGHSLQPEIFKEAAHVNVGVSAFHGLIAWNEYNEFCKLSVLEPTSSAPSVDELLAVAEPAESKPQPISIPHRQAQNLERPMLAERTVREPVTQANQQAPRESYRDAAFLFLAGGGLAFLFIANRGWRSHTRGMRVVLAGIGCALLGGSAVPGVGFVQEMLVISGLKSSPPIYADEDVELLPITPPETVPAVRVRTSYEQTLEELLARLSVKTQSQPALASTLDRVHQSIHSSYLPRDARTRVVQQLEIMNDSKELVEGGQACLLDSLQVSPPICSYDPVARKMWARGAVAMPPPGREAHILCHVTIDLLSMDGSAFERRLVDEYVRGAWSVNAALNEQVEQRMTIRIAVSWLRVDPGVGPDGIGTAALANEIAKRKAAGNGVEIFGTTEQTCELKRTDYRQTATNAPYWTMAIGGSKRMGENR